MAACGRTLGGLPLGRPAQDGLLADRMQLPCKAVSDGWTRECFERSQPGIPLQARLPYVVTAPSQIHPLAQDDYTYDNSLNYLAA